jgi:hypothetical protein
MKRSSISIWKHARSQFDDLPYCPDDLNEPQYAELLFGKSCTVSLVLIFQESLFTNPSQFCQRSLASNIVIWTSRVRTCAKCLSEKYILLCTLISSAYIPINRFSPHIFMSRYPRHLLNSIQVITFVKSSKYFLSLETVYVLLCLFLNRENSTRKIGISS